MKNSLYQLTTDVENLYTLLEDSIDLETGEVDQEINKALECKEEEFNDKAIGVAYIWRMFKQKQEMIDFEIARLTAIKNRAKSIQDRLENSLTSACDRLQKDKIEGISANISFRSSERTIIENENEIPEEFFNVTMIKKVDLKKVKNAIHEGAFVPGARIEKKKNIQIK